MGKVIMIIWMGSGYGQVFDTLQFDSMVDCEKAKSAMAETIRLELDGGFTVYSGQFLKTARCVDTAK